MLRRDASDSAVKIELYLFRFARSFARADKDRRGELQCSLRGVLPGICETSETTSRHLAGVVVCQTRRGGGANSTRWSTLFRLRHPSLAGA